MYRCLLRRKLIELLCRDNLPIQAGILGGKGEKGTLPLEIPGRGFFEIALLEERPSAGPDRFLEGKPLGYEIPIRELPPWLETVEPKHVLSPWMALDQGPGALAAMALALEDRSRVVLLDDQPAPRARPRQPACEVSQTF
jgi:hypothetical protein